MKTVIKKHRHFLVAASHAGHVSYKVQPQHLKNHLSATVRRKGRTLCNMVVIDSITKSSPYAARELCSTCLRVAEDKQRDTFENVAAKFHISTDASFSSELGGIAGWAAHIKSSGYSHDLAGTLEPGEATNSGIAELLAIDRAFGFLNSFLDVVPDLKDSPVLVTVSTDSKFALKAVLGNQRVARDSQVIPDVVSRISRRGLNKIVAVHVKGHVDNPTRWQERANAWCDEESRKQLNTIKEELRDKASPKEV